jgi:hypothetical protein
MTVGDLSNHFDVKGEDKQSAHNVLFMVLSAFQTVLYNSVKQEWEDLLTWV